MLTYPQIDPVLVSIGPVKVHWYGMMYLLGFTAFWVLGRYRSKRSDSPVNAEQVGDLLFYGALGAVLGGRLGYMLFYTHSAWMQDPLEIFRIWNGGMSYHGGMLGVFLAMYLYARKLRTTFFTITDFIAPLVPIGLGCGRIGNFINGELWGRPTDMPWGMVFRHVDNIPRHPSSLYQAALEGIVLFTVLWLYSSKPRPRGMVSGAFLIGYGVIRVFAEFFRQPDAQLNFIAFGWLTMGQLLSVPMILAGIAIMWWGSRQPKAEETV